MTSREGLEFWQRDIKESVDYYNHWYRSTVSRKYYSIRNSISQQVQSLFDCTNDLLDCNVAYMKEKPDCINYLRFITAPPISRERLCGLSHVPLTILKGLESGRRVDDGDEEKLSSLASLLECLLAFHDQELFPWLNGGERSFELRDKALCVVVDRMSQTVVDTVMRNEQEKRQLHVISEYLHTKGYQFIHPRKVADFRRMPVGSYTFHLNVPVTMADEYAVNISVDVLIKCFSMGVKSFPLLIECKSSGDYTNTNKRRKEEAVKMQQLRRVYGDDIKFILFLGGYFNLGYLQYESAEGISWVWEHRITDLGIHGV